MSRRYNLHNGTRYELTKVGFQFWEFPTEFNATIGSYSTDYCRANVDPSRSNWCSFRAPEAAEAGYDPRFCVCFENNRISVRFNYSKLGLTIRDSQNLYVDSNALDTELAEERRKESERQQREAESRQREDDSRRMEEKRRRDEADSRRREADRKRKGADRKRKEAKRKQKVICFTENEGFFCCTEFTA